MRGLPVLNVRGESIPEAWENSILELASKGRWYKRGDPDDKDKQVDATMMITVENPDSEEFMHKWMTCGIEDLLDYEMEIHGAKDSWRKDLNDESDNRWDYLYHERLASYPGSKGTTDQIIAMIDKLSERPFSRRACSTLWVPERDAIAKDTPCLQGIRFLITPKEEDQKEYFLNMTYNFRSRNVMIAAPMNMIGLYALQCTVRDAIIKKTGMKLENGRITDFTDSYHVSSRDQETLKKFLEMRASSLSRGETIKDRTYTRDFVFSYMNNILPERTEAIINQTEKYLSGEKLSSEISKIRAIADARKR